MLARLGTPAPELPPLSWLGAQPGADALRGRVVLMRFFTNTCPFCRTSAPAIAQLQRRFGGEGLTVLGIYHPKPRGRAYDPQEVREFVRSFDWSFPVALDDDWEALDRFWPADTRRYTSFSILIDRQGLIRYVHPGPEFHESEDPDHQTCDQDFRDLERSIESLLARE